MDVKVDNERILTLDTNPANAQALLAALSESLKKQGLLIKSLTVDGLDIFARECDSIAGTAAVEVTTEDAATYAGRLLAELDEVLPELPTACHSLAAVFQGNAPSDGFEPFQRLAEIWSVVKERQLEAAEVLDCSLEEIRVEGMTFKRMHEELNRYLEEAAGALQVKDCVLLGDLLEYELAPRAAQEADIVTALRQRIAQHAS